MKIQVLQLAIDGSTIESEYDEPPKNGPPCNIASRSPNPHARAASPSRWTFSERYMGRWTRAGGMPIKVADQLDSPASCCFLILFQKFNSSLVENDLGPKIMRAWQICKGGLTRVSSCFLSSLRRSR